MFLAREECAISRKPSFVVMTLLEGMLVIHKLGSYYYDAELY